MPDPAEFELPPRPGHPVAREESTSWPDRVGTTMLGSGYEGVLVEDGYGFLAIFWHGDSATQLWAARLVDVARVKVGVRALDSEEWLTFSPDDSLRLQELWGIPVYLLECPELL